IREATVGPEQRSPSKSGNEVVSSGNANCRDLKLPSSGGCAATGKQRGTAVGGHGPKRRATSSNDLTYAAVCEAAGVVPKPIVSTSEHAQSFVDQRRRARDDGVRLQGGAISSAGEGGVTRRTKISRCSSGEVGRGPVTIDVRSPGKG
ncbi:unnamed protein product, partial [Sphacelaria rigidula]